MSENERSEKLATLKLKRFLNNVRYLGDVGKAAAKARVSRNQLDRWMNQPSIASQIDAAFRDAQMDLHNTDSAKDVLFRAKIFPQLEEDGEFFRKTGQRHRESRVIAKLAANDLKASRWQIVQAARNNDKNFFIDLGKILSGEISGALCDQIDEALVEICVGNPATNTRQIITALRNRGIMDVEEGTIRTRKSRLGLTRKRDCK